MSENENFDPHAGDGGPADDGNAGQQPETGDSQTFEQIVEGVELENPEDQKAGDLPSRENQLEGLLAERTEDLQRLQAEYVNFKKRSDRERSAAKQSGVEKVVASLVPVLDAIHMAREHGEVTEGSGFKAVTDALEKVAADHELTAFGAVGDAFDPYLHNALMQVPLPGATVVSVSQVMGRGYKVGDRVVRPAQVAVSDPDPAAVTGENSEGGDDGAEQDDQDSADDSES